ncbi:MAG: hypothetical protein AAGE96_09760 [Cyanobacteria bacterium P01_G01_bin.19]
MSVEIIAPIAAVIILFLIVAWLFKVFKASIKTILTIAAIFIVLQLAFGINSQDLGQELLQIVARIKQLIF